MTQNHKTTKKVAKKMDGEYIGTGNGYMKSIEVRNKLVVDRIKVSNDNEVSVKFKYRDIH